MADFVNNQLKAWGLEHLVPIFQEEAITDKVVFLEISENIIKDVIPKAGDRFKFLKEREAYLTAESESENNNTERKSHHPYETDDTLSVSSTLESAESAETSTKFGQKLKNLLKGSIVGATLLKQTRLTLHDRKKLCNIIVDHLLGISPKISSLQFVYWSKEIVHVFKFEKEEAYYVPYKGGRLKRLASGRLWDRYVNVKRYIKSKLACAEQVSNDLQLEVPDDVKDNLLRLNTISSQDEDLKTLWRETTSHRDKKNSITEYYSKYPILKTPIGLSLLQLDFESLNITTDTLIFHKKWPDIAQRILKLAQNQKVCKDIICSIADVSIEGQALIVLPYLLRSSLVKTKNKKLWKPSRQETANSFILRIMSMGDFDLELTRKRDLLRSYQLTIQPFVLAVGPSITSTYLIIDDVKYECASLESAVDACFKAFYALDAEYPREGEMVWNFLQRFVYCITNNAVSDKHYVCVESLWTELCQLDLG